MARKKKQATANKQNGANLGFEPKLWAAADALRNNMDAAEYKRVILRRARPARQHPVSATLSSIHEPGYIALEMERFE